MDTDRALRSGSVSVPILETAQKENVLAPGETRGAPPLAPQTEPEAVAHREGRADLTPLV
jgi:hypothetical protein